jgi:hypothetical protein
MPKIPLALPAGSYTGRDGQVANTRLINAYAEANGEEAKSPFTVYAAPGMTSWGSGSYTGAWRGGIERDTNALVVVSGNQVITYDASGTPTVTNTISGTKRVIMARNRKFTSGVSTPQIAIVADEGQYYILEDDVLTHVSDSDLPAPNAGVDYLKGFFIFGTEDGRLYSSAVEDGESIDADAYEYINAKNARLRRIFVNSGFCYVWTDKSMEIWQADPTLADEPFSFSAVNQDIALGISAPFSVAAHTRGNVWVDHNRQVRLGRDGSSARISNHALERKLEELTIAQMDDLYGFVYSFHGHETYCLTSATWSWHYDSATAKWHERKTYNDDNDRWRVDGHVNFNGTQILGNYEDGTLYQLDPDTHTDAGEHLVMELWCPQSHNFPDTMIVDAVHIDVISGVGLTTTVDADEEPHIMIDYSDDGGKNFYGERTISIGKIGEYTKRVSSYRWGRTNEKGRIWRFKASAAVLRGINQAFLDARPLNA